MSKCVLLNTSFVYSDAHEALLRKILMSKPDLFSVVGVECEVWEEAMDWLCINQTLASGTEVFCNTTSHPGETLDDVIAFTERWCKCRGWSNDVEIIEI